jgi:protein tyrosine/serine phosphatase
MPTRVIELERAHNVRDLGGLPTTAGRTTRHGRLVRAEFTDLVAPGDVDRLVRRIGLKTVVDLRRRSEIRHESVPWHDHGVHWHNLPFGLGKGSAVAIGKADYVAIYLGYLENDPATVVKAVELLLDPDAHPAMFHCAAGKDRTGVLSALLLDVAGVTHDAIAEDYALSAAGLEAVLARLAAQAPYEKMLAGYTVEDNVPVPGVMLDFLDRLGGARSWLLGHGVSEQRLERFRTAFAGG